MMRNDLKLVLIFILAGFLIGPRIFAEQKAASTDSAVAVKQKNTEIAPAKPNPFAHIELTAKSAFVWDVANQRVLFDKEAETPRTLASLTKIMTAVVALESKKANAEVTIGPDDLQVEGHTDLLRDERWSLSDLLALTLVESSNHGASAIAASVGASMDTNPGATRQDDRESFIGAMNAKAKQLGLTSLVYTSPSGLDKGSISGGMGSARDIAHLFEYVLKYHSNLLQYTALPEITVTSKQHIVHHVENTNEIAAATPGIIGGKTGYTDMAGGNLAMVVDMGIQQPVIIVALGSTREQRFTDVESLLNASKIAFENNN